MGWGAELEAAGAAAPRGRPALELPVTSLLQEGHQQCTRAGRTWQPQRPLLLTTSDEEGGQGRGGKWLAEGKA